LFLYWLNTNSAYCSTSDDDGFMTFLGGICQDGSSRAICMDDEFTLCKRRDMIQRDPFLPNIHKCKRGGLCKTNQHPTPRSYYDP
jgi:hypothetical protein